MNSTYQTYTDSPFSLTFEEMQLIHESIVNSIENDEDATELYGDLLAKVNEYANMRMGWVLFSQDEKRDSDPIRTSYHDAVIMHFNMLARYLKSKGYDTSWRDTLGYEKDSSYNRKRIGDFACYLAFVNGLNAR